MSRTRRESEEALARSFAKVMKQKPLSNADKQRNWRQRQKAWIALLEEEIGPERVAELRERIRPGVEEVPGREG